MTPSDWFTLIGIVMTALSAAATVYGVLNGRISKAARTLHEKIDEVKRDYVRRDDLRDDIHNFKEDINRIERGQENIAAKVDGFSAALLPAIADLAKVAIALRNK
ncbi:MAG TPA: hypothetical protein VHE77_14310 [Dongiaceae bacterium]|jgi:hypothetical protein|nr:hypothetical protein [Dongiaceae bacterium]